MRTVELSDEVFELATRAAEARGLTVVEYVGRRIAEDAPAEKPSVASGKRLDFPLIRSERPGTLDVTKEMINDIELDDYLGRNG